MSAPRGLALVARALEREGILLESDARLPSATTLVAGEPVRGSWWAHPRGRAIYAVLEVLLDGPDVLTAKLVSGKVTLVHRALWPALVAVATSREPWQTRGLSAAARALWKKVEAQGELRTDQLPKTLGTAKLQASAVARDLELRLCVHAESVHTESGAHARKLESWERCGERRNLRGALPSPAEARATFEAIAQRWSLLFVASARLPWIANLRS